MSKTSLVWLISALVAIIIIMVFDIHDKNTKINELNNNIVNLYQENTTLKKNLAVAKGLLQYIGD